MSRTKNNRIRCDGCGIISSDDHGYYRRGETGGTISTHGRCCEHDYCDECEVKLERPWSRCPKCGDSPLNYVSDEERTKLLPQAPVKEGGE